MLSKQSTFGPYSPVRRVGNLLFVSGQVGVDAKRNVAHADIRAQTLQALLNLEKILLAEGADSNCVVKTTVFLTNMDYFSAMNEVYEKFFKPPRPARSCVAVTELPRVAGDVKLLVEIEAIAYRGLENDISH